LFVGLERMGAVYRYSEGPETCSVIYIIRPSMIPTWYAKVYTINDTHALDQSQEDAMRKEMSANEWRQEMLCDFTAASDDTLISIDLVEQAAGKHLREDQYDFSAKIIGVDVARYGGDRSVIFKRQGLSSDIHFQTTHIDNMTLAAKWRRFSTNGMQTRSS